ncbi:MAG: UDP-N-acetylglucosamine--N-acetylmuramyl-(pentapeptide) pyrophosphoryl-undecaprenol N-acetylglucosamine transferase [Candidatus Omnitrophica bacterium]|nr:UDP-N-acetylglucosamine--N-acetylmuramyl-(pentapeptide) pyrophosphoryl-undecaprenol N-acetylglucosamine transferase [Candidatus Omnitrophota bacterium]
MKIVIGAGGTGGHLIPAIVLAKHLRRLGHDISFVGAAKSDGSLITKSGFIYYRVAGEGFQSRRWLNRTYVVFTLFKGLLSSVSILRHLKPQVLIGFGGYGSIPAVLGGRLLRIPCMIHEQNVIPGKANRLLVKFVQGIAISFAQTAEHINGAKVIVTGCPCHADECDGVSDKKGLYQFFKLSPDKPTILVFGGSQGSHFINKMFLETIADVHKEKGVQVIHISGTDDYPWLKKAYDENGIPVALFSFFDKMNDAYGVADVIVARAGAVTVSEILSFNKSALLIPYPYAAEGHQKMNGLVLERKGLGKVLEEKDITEESFKEHLFVLLDKHVQREISDVNQGFNTRHPVELLSTALLSLVKSKS